MSGIRIGGKGRKRTLSLSSPLPRLIATVAETVDWENSLQLAGFDQAETEFILSTRLEGRTRAETARAMKWTSRKAKAIEERVCRKLAFGPVAPHLEPMMHRPSGVSFQLRLAPGHSVWDMTPPNPIEPFLMHLERIIFHAE